LGGVLERVLLGFTRRQLLSFPNPRSSLFFQMIGSRNNGRPRFLSLFIPQVELEKS
jgi:hypothetical protein